MTERKPPGEIRIPGTPTGKDVGGIEGADSSTVNPPDQQDQRADQGGFRTPPEGFQRRSMSAGFAQMMRTMHKMDNTTMTAFRLIGTNKVVQDLRNAAERASRSETPAARHEGHITVVERQVPQQIREGKLEPVKEPPYKNYLAEPKPGREPQIKGPGKDIGERQFSSFEEKLLQRFEGGKVLEKPQEDGKASFLEKTLEQWKSFFQKFIDRTVKKSAELAEVQELVFRGMVKKGDAKAVLISDMIHTSGSVEKFIRFGVIYQKISDFLASLLPGDIMAKQALAKGLPYEKLFYLALLPPAASSEFQTDALPRQGMFATEALEAQVAKELGLSMADKGSPAADQQRMMSGKGKKRVGGFWKWLVGGEEVADESVGQFIPAWQYGLRKKPKPTTLKRVFYSAVFIMFVLIILFIINQLLSGK